jgi:RNA polymerase sigma factor (sigma-70 family)
MVPQSRSATAKLIYKPPAMSDGDETEDAHLVERARTGDRDARQAAFAVLITRYEGFVRSMLYRLSGNAADAEELAQEAFMTAWLKLNSLQTPAAFRGWLKQLAYRQFLHSYRRGQVEQRYAETIRDEPVVEMEMNEDIEPLLALCTPLERELMVLCYGFEFTHAEISASRNMAVGTIKSHVHRAKQKIKTFLEQQDGASLQGESQGELHG